MPVKSCAPLQTSMPTRPVLLYRKLRSSMLPLNSIPFPSVDVTMAVQMCVCVANRATTRTLHFYTGSPLRQVLRALDACPAAEVDEVTAAAVQEVQNLPSAAAPVPQLDASPPGQPDAGCDHPPCHTAATWLARTPCAECCGNKSAADFYRCNVHSVLRYAELPNVVGPKQMGVLLEERGIWQQMSLIDANSLLMF